MKQNKKIVVYGPDNSGKTTLVDQIVGFSNTCSQPIKKMKSLGPAPVDEQIRYMDENLAIKGHVIFDRYPVIEEETCGIVLRQHNNFGEAPTLYTKYIKAIDLFIFCNPGLDAILNWGEREQMVGIKENIFPLYFSYCLVYKKFRELGINVMEYNWKSKDGLFEVARRVLE